VIDPLPNLRSSPPWFLRFLALMILIERSVGNLGSDSQLHTSGDVWMMCGDVGSELSSDNPPTPKRKKPLGT